MGVLGVWSPNSERLGERLIDARGDTIQPLGACRPLRLVMGWDLWQKTPEWDRNQWVTP